MHTLVKTYFLGGTMNILKKILGIVMMLSLLVGTTLAFASCGGDGEDPDDGPAGDPPPAVTPDYPDPIPAPNIVLYTITVKDEAGNPAKGVKVQIVDEAGESRNEKTTGDTGVVTFNVQEGTWKAQVLKGTGYTADYGTKVDFVSAAAELSVDMCTYVINAKTVDNGVIKDLSVALYALGQDGYAAEPTATVVTNKYGEAAFDVAAGAYKAVATDATGLYAAAELVIAADSAIKVFDLPVDYEEGTEQNPIIVTGDFTAELKAGQTLWYSFEYEAGAYILVEDANAVVHYSGGTYSVATGAASVKIPLAELADGVTTGTALFSVSSNATIPEGQTTVSVAITFGVEAAQ